jgi:alpha-L-fucosidase
MLELRLRQPRTLDCAVLMEDIREGERVKGFALEGLKDGEWKPLAAGPVIGHKRIVEFAPVAVRAVRLCVTAAVGRPLIRTLAVYRVGAPSPTPPARLEGRRAVR